jgi:DNA-binding NarL/FixJ family response regulator
MSTSEHAITPTQAEFHRLVANFRACQEECRASIERLRSAERELAECGHALGIDHLPFTAEERALLGSNVLVNMPGLKSLSEREREVFRLIGKGYTTHEIAEQLKLALSTIETYRERLKHKLNFSNGAALTRCAILQTEIEKG